MTDLRPIDADNHYYETLDAFTRHLEKEYVRRGVQVAQVGRRTVLLMGERANHFIPNPTFDPIAVPGCLDLYFRGDIPQGQSRAGLMQVEPLANRPEYQDRDARIARLDEQGLAAAVLYPTVGVGVEEALRADIPAIQASLRAFNRWLEDDWGYAYQGRLFAVPMISLSDPDAALVEVDRVIALGAKAVVVRPAPVPGVLGPRSLGDPLHDPVWRRLAEAGVAVTFHAADSGYTRLASQWGVPETLQSFKPSVLGKVVTADRAIFDTFASLIVDGVLSRFPALRVISIENGSDWVRPLLKIVKKSVNQAPEAFSGDPVAQFRDQVWVAPYYEDDISGLIELIGADKVLFGSDWPHAEGLYEPTSYEKEIDFLDADTKSKIMRDNMQALFSI